MEARQVQTKAYNLVEFEKIFKWFTYTAFLHTFFFECTDKMKLYIK